MVSAPPRSVYLPTNFRAMFGAAVVAAGVFASWLWWQFGGETVVLYVSDAGTVLSPLLATIACYRAGLRSQRQMRRFWWLLAAACGSWMLGESIWTGYDLAGGEGPPIPSLADVGYLLFIPLAVAALLHHPGLKGSGSRKARTLFDGIAIAMSLLFLSWTFVLGPLWRTGDLTTAGGIVALAYPVGDVVIAFFVLLAIRRMKATSRLGLWCLLAGLIALALADSAFAYVVEVKGYTTGNMLDTGWFAGFLGIALGAVASTVGEVDDLADSPLLALPSLLAPLLPIFVALSVAGILMRNGQRPDKVAVAMVCALIVLTLLRQLLLVLDFIRAGRGKGDGELLDRATRVMIRRNSGQYRPEARPVGRS